MMKVKSLSQIEYSKKGHERLLLKPFSVQTDFVNGLNYEVGYVKIKDDIITVYNGFTWNGCTVARDSKKTDNASCVHDALYSVKSIPLDRKTKDLIFYYLLKEQGFYASYIYYLGVRTFGKVAFDIMNFFGVKVKN